MSMGEIIDEATQYAKHWQLRDYLRAQLQKDRDEPQPETLYILSDWQDWQGLKTVLFT